MDPVLQPKPLSFKELQEVLSEVSYKPGWTISLYMDETMGRPVLYVVGKAPNAYKLNETITLYIRTLIPTWIIEDVESFLRWLQQRFIELEIHECLEYLRYKGECVYDPHDPIEPMKGVSNSETVATPGRSSRQTSDKFE